MYNALKSDGLRQTAGRTLRLILAAVFLSHSLQTYAQSNCSLFTEPNQIKACKFYNSVDSLPQGTSMCEQALDSALYYWPGYAEAWHEKSVPYLKRGDFLS